MITSCHLKISALFAALLAIVAKADLRDELSTHFIHRVSISNVPLSQAVTTLSNIWEKTIGKDVMFRIDQQEGDAGGGEVKLVTIVAENISYYEAFSIICAEAQMDMDFDDAGNAVPFEARGIQSSRGASLALADDPPSAGFAHFARSVEAWFANSAWGSLSRRRDFSLPNAIQRELNRARIRESHKTGKPAKGGKDAAKKKEGTDHAE